MATATKGGAGKPAASKEQDYSYAGQLKWQDLIHKEMRWQEMHMKKGQPAEFHLNPRSLKPIALPVGYVDKTRSDDPAAATRKQENIG
jgi:hypothetical protein